MLYRRYNITNVPVPEVTAYKENPDGTLTITVEAVWKERMTDCAFIHGSDRKATRGEKFPVYWK